MLYPGSLDCCTECTGELIFNPGGVTDGFQEVTMHTPAWCCVDLTPLWAGADTRGGNVMLPGSAGTFAYPRRKDETDYQLPLAISGVTDQTGLLAADARTQLYTNITYLRTNVINPPDASTATRSATLTLPDGITVLTAEVQVVKFQQGEHLGPIVKAMMTIRIPAGQFV